MLYPQEDFPDSWASKVGLLVFHLILFSFETVITVANVSVFVYFLFYFCYSHCNVSSAPLLFVAFFQSFVE
jgi:hypothetical protein